jgi:putative cell wall-binding protein
VQRGLEREMDMRRRFLLVIGVVLAVAVGGTTAAGAVVTYVRVQGTDRYDTAVVLANQFVTSPSATVYVASGETFPDALAASAAAAHVGAPVLLTHPGSLPTGTHDELVALKPTTVVIVGGTAAVSDAVKTAIKTAVPDASVLRVGTSSVGTRYDTAAALSQSAFGTDVPVAYIASGETFPDALSGAAAAGTLGGPVLLVQPTGAESQSFVNELQRLHPARIVLLGGYNAISLQQEAYIQSQVAVTVTRISGNDRYETSVAVSADAFDPGVPSVFLTTGENYPDGLAAGAIAGAAHVPVLLTHKTCLPQSVADEITRLDPAQVYVIGGTGAIAYPVDSPPPICS